MKKFTSDVVKWWILWSRIYHDKEVNIEEAERQLEILREFVKALKNYPR